MNLAEEIGFHKADESHVGKEFRFHVDILISKAIEVTSFNNSRKLIWMMTG